VPFTGEQTAEKSNARFIVIRYQNVCVSNHQDARNLQNEGR
jgi:predicted choloylglycine hydrolase